MLVQTRRGSRIRACQACQSTIRVRRTPAAAWQRAAARAAAHGVIRELRNPRERPGAATCQEATWNGARGRLPAVVVARTARPDRSDSTQPRIRAYQACRSRIRARNVPAATLRPAAAQAGGYGAIRGLRVPKGRPGAAACQEATWRGARGRLPAVVVAEAPKGSARMSLWVAAVSRMAEAATEAQLPEDAGLSAMHARGGVVEPSPALKSREGSTPAFGRRECAPYARRRRA